MKKTKKEIKILIWLILFIALIGFYNKHLILSTTAQAPSDRYAYLPDNLNRELKTDKDKIRLEAYKICNEYGLGDNCRLDLEGIVYAETIVFDCNANGDFGASHGCYQIHLGYHPEITQEQARSVKFATKWTLDRLLHYGYPKYRSYAIRRHNGSANNPKTLTYLNKVNNYIINN